MTRVLISGRAPEPPPAFDASSAAPTDFDPPLTKEAPRKVLKTGKSPHPPPAFDREASAGAGAKFDPPLKAPSHESSSSTTTTAAPPKYVSVPKVLSSGSVPAPPPAFDPAGFVPGDFDPPVSFAGGEPSDGAAATAGATGAAAADAPADDATAAPKLKGYRIKRKAT